MWATASRNLFLSKRVFAEAITLQVPSAGCARSQLLRDTLKVLASGPQLSLEGGIIGVGNLRAEFSECFRQQISKFTCLFVIQLQFHVGHLIAVDSR